ncbi:uncharacterized protein [Aegilops tauschii subsp. strangulata]|uniref:uncharacterized protein n=1 Tax=Aegilops tauschii subsp. strangulata TaxID=200361 RepID=UPI00098A23FC|nr:uncharacterized protein LOC109739504 [Aegilops tauschii subsp. strangulata]
MATIWWPDLPPELLGAVLSRLPSYLEHVRLRAVCGSWRSSARTQQPSPLLPWAGLRSGAFLDLAEGALDRLPVPEADVVRRVSTGRLLFLVRRDGRCFLMDPHSGDATPQHIEPEYLCASLQFSDFLLVHPRSSGDTTAPQQITHLVADSIRKVVVSDDLVAVLIRRLHTSNNVGIYTRGGTMRMAWAPPPEFPGRAVDMALFKGKLYVLASEVQRRSYELHALDMATGESVQCIPSSTPPTRADEGYNRVREVRFYLVPSGDRLLMVEHTIDHMTYQQTYLPSQFEVFEAADLELGDGHGRWREVDTLMGRALFVSQGCSESPPASGIGAREDCIYFMSERERLGPMARDATMTELESGVYNMREGMIITPLPPLETATEASVDGPWSPTWLFPPAI